MLKHTCDTCVIGGGSAGVAAAYSAARAGASVLLVERYGFLGGMGTGAIIGTFCGFYSSGQSPRPLAGAFGWTVVNELVRRKAAYRFSFQRTSLIHYDSEVLKLVYDNLIERAGVKVLLHSLFSGVVTEKDGRIKSLQVITRGEPVTISARVFIDCSGDADLCYRAGAATEFGDESGEVQPGTLVFRMCGVDFERASKLNRQELIEQMRRDVDEGLFRLPRIGGWFYPTTHPGEVVVNMTRILNLNGIDAHDLTRGEQEGRRQVQEYARWLRERAAGFEQAFVSAVGTQVGLRETRRIVGRARLNADDLRSGRRGDDDLAAGAWPFEIHSAGSDTTSLEWLPDDVVYNIPLGAVVPRDFTNLLVAGRCISTSPEAHASTRVIGTCFSVGEAVGAIAAQRAKDSQHVGGWTNGILDGVQRWRSEVSQPPDDAWPPYPFSK